MHGLLLKSIRQEGGWSQREAAARLGISQPYYSQLESGARGMPFELAQRIVRRLGASPVALPLPPLSPALAPIDEDTLASGLGRIGYPGFAHLATGGKPINPALLVSGALAHDDLDIRIVEGLPWALAAFPDLDWTWLIAQCRLTNTQNRLGYLVSLARQLEKPGSAEALDAALAELEKSRLAIEDTLCDERMTAVERRWTAKRRPDAAVHWGLITTLTAKQLTHAI